MIYSENVPITSKTSLTLKISDFSKGVNTRQDENVLPLNYAINSYNFSFTSGALKNGLGLKELSVPTDNSTTKSFNLPTGVNKLLNIWHFRRYNKTLGKFEPYLVSYADNGYFYYGMLDDLDSHLYQLSNFTFNSKPVGVNYRIEDLDCLIFCSPNSNDDFAVWDGINYPVLYANAPEITSAVLYAGRLFVTTGGDKSQLWFSDDLDPRNWTVNQFAGGYIELTDERGCLNKVIETNNYLYIIRDFGITRVSAWGEQTDFIVRNLYLSTGKIYSNSAVLCGDDIIMLCRDGLYLFDGTDTTKICSGLDKYFTDMDNENAIGVFIDGKYYLACKLNFDDDKIVGCESGANINNALIEYDIDTREINILRGVDIGVMTSFQTQKFSKLVIALNSGNTTKLMELTRDGQVFGTSTKKVWTSPFSDLGYPAKQKILKKFYINTQSALKLEIKTEKMTYTFNLKGDVAPICVPLNIKCKKFSFNLETDSSDCAISDAELQLYLA